MILRLSQKLSSKIEAGKLNVMPLDKNPDADWSSHLFTADRIQSMILTNSKPDAEHSIKVRSILWLLTLHGGFVDSHRSERCRFYNQSVSFRTR